MDVEKGNSKAGRIFPLELESAVDAYAWMCSNLKDQSRCQVDPLAQKWGLARLRAKQPNLFLFLDQMKYLRGSVMFSGDNKSSYDNGIIFMMQTLHNQFLYAGQSFPTLSAFSLSNYFQNLVDVEINYHEVEELKQAQGIDPSMPLFPYALANLALDSSAQTPTLIRVRDTFISKSEEAAHHLCDDEEVGEKIIRRGELANRFGPIKGFVYGATDIYTAVEQFEQAKSLRRLLGIELK